MPVSTFLIESNVFFREGLKTLLADTEFQVDAIYSSVTAIGENQEKEQERLVILGMEDDTGPIAKTLMSIKKTFPRSRIALLAANENKDYIASAFAAGADGYILRDISPPALIASLGMIMMGEKVYPAAMMNMFLKRHAGNETGKPAFSNSHLSSREMQVLRYLAEGESNKQIARSLDIAESTVKVHIKAVLRKLELSNRTQAAVWAVNEGITHPGSG